MKNVDTSEMIGEPRSLRKSDFAKLVGVTPGRVSQMIASGLPVEADGRIDVARGKLWISDNISPTRSAAQSDQASLPFAAIPNASTERARLVKEQADNVAMKNAALRRELVPASEVKALWARIIRQARSKILSAPSRIRQGLPHLSARDVEAIDAELRRTLEELANDQ